MKRFIPLSLVLACLTGCVNQNDYESLQRRVQEQDAQLRQMQPAQADSWAQMQAIQQELNQMKGQFDDLQSVGGARAIVDKLNRHDAALRQVETSLAVNLNLDPATPPEAAPVSGQQPSPGAQLTPPAASANQHQTGEAASQDTAVALFNAGKTDFTARNYKAAQRSFMDFTNTYKNHSYMPDAQYYVAECYFQQNQFPEAALEYDKVINKYPKSSKAPAAYLKQGICFSKLGQSAAAKTRMKELIKKYPKSAEAARANTFLKTNK